jgi:hypothetical protein
MPDPESSIYLRKLWKIRKTRHTVVVFFWNTVILYHK